MVKTNYDFIEKHISLQGIEVLYTNVNNGIFQVFASSAHNFAVCPRCRRITQNVHDRRWQPLKHLPIWGMDTVVMLLKKRYICDCGPKHPFDEQFDFVRKYQRQTVAFEKRVFILTHKNTIKNASEIAGISEGKCQGIYNHYAQFVLEAREPESLRLLGIDDIARKKGHNYNTVVYNQETGNVAALITGRKKEDVITYLKEWPEEVRLNVEAVSLDMSRSYCHSILECFPNAKPVVDRFHLAQNFRKCADNARKHIQNHIRKYGKKQEVFKIRWALLKNVEDLKRDEALPLILACTKYPVIEGLHYLKEEFREFFNLETKEDAIAFIEYYKGLVAEYDIPELKTFCKTLDNWLPYILNYYDYRISNGLTEGNNHKVKNIKRRAYGYRNDHTSTTFNVESKKIEVFLK
ncbi:MAG: ISL3 family transposase [Clostridiales bacterium]|jgi:transposase|nr:ISL3 family transposase [Eubacteriales bacterium]MDH7567733.1 ISL3 family transposase [Clostridiales bacterium]